MEFKSDGARYLIFRNKLQYDKSVTLLGLNEESLTLKYSQRRGKWRFYRGEPGPEMILLPSVECCLL